MPPPRNSSSSYLPILAGNCISRILAIAAVALVSIAAAAPREIDVRSSVMIVHVYKSGVFSALGHDHEIAAPLEAGTVDLDARTVELHVKSGALRVRDPKASDKDRAEIQKTMTSPDVLDVERHPEIAFRSTKAEPLSDDSWKVTGELTLHGETHPIIFEVRRQAGRYSGHATLKQTDFGMKPIKVAGGTVRVKDEVRIEFDIQLR